MKTPQLIEPNGGGENEERPPLLFSMRFLLALIIFTGVGMQYMQKIDMGIAIVCMVNATAVKNLEPNESHILPTNLTGCLFNPETKNSTDGEFVWTKSVQGFILSSYFYGYILTQIPGGYLSMKYGGKRVLGLSMLFGSIATILSAPIANLGYQALIVFRFITGFSHGFMWPAISSMFIKWATPEEKSRLVGFASAGTNIGNILALPLGGLLCESGFYHGWGSIFIIFGLMGVIWTVILAVFTSSSPVDHKYISEKEKDYLIRNISSSEMSINETKSLIGRRPRTPPWKAMLTSKPCIAIFCAHVSANWGNYLFLTQMPTFMKDVLQFDIKSNGFFSSIPYLFCLTFAGLSSLIADRLIVSKTLPRSIIRKIFNTTGQFVPMVLVICLSFVDCAHPYLGVFLLALGVGFLGCCVGAGYQVNFNEIGGCYSGVLLSVSNTFATISGIVAPYIVGLLTPNGTADEWKVVFYITAVVYIVGGSIYLAYSSSDIEKWALVDQHEDND